MILVKGYKFFECLFVRWIGFILKHFQIYNFIFFAQFVVQFTWRFDASNSDNDDSKFKVAIKIVLSLPQ